MSNQSTTKTDRDLWADPPIQGGIFGIALVSQGRADDISEGLKALAATYFDDFTDAEDLPRWFHEAVEYAYSQHNLDIPGPYGDDAFGEDDDEEEPPFETSYLNRGGVE